MPTSRGCAAARLRRERRGREGGSSSWRCGTSDLRVTRGFFTPLPHSPNKNVSLFSSRRQNLDSNNCDQTTFGWPGPSNGGRRVLACLPSRRRPKKGEDRRSFSPGVLVSYRVGEGHLDAKVFRCLSPTRTNRILPHWTD
jgi:hypothetical protein